MKLEMSIVPTEGQIGRMRDMAGRLLTQAQDKMNTGLENTPKRQRHASCSRVDGAQMERAASYLNGWASNPEGKPFTKKGAMDAAKKRVDYGTGYYSCALELDTWYHEGATAQRIRSFGHDNQERQAEQKHAAEMTEIRNAQIDGFFPTPPAVVEIMFEYVGDLEGKSVLEPSCGIGSLIQPAFDAGAKSVVAYEINHKLAEITRSNVRFEGQQSLVVQTQDFLEVSKQPIGFDGVVMNPPFEKKQWIAHIVYAFEMLKSGGCLVSVVPSNGQSGRFLGFLEDKDYMFVELDQNSFAGKESIKQTQVSTSLVVINK